MTTWFMSVGNAGSRNQARALALAVDPHAEERVVDTRWPWSLLPAGLFALSTAGIAGAAPPWPDLIVSSGRRAGMAARAIKRAHPGTTIVHIERPAGDLQAFDLVVALPHDEAAGPNVLVVDTALHAITPEALAGDRDQWRDRFASLPRPVTGVLLGGSTQRRPFTLDQAEAMLRELQALRDGGGLAITPSRRTPALVLEAFRRRFATDPGVFVWDREGDNPYRGILGLADRLVVTGDSISMISEALGAGVPVWVFEVGGGPRHQRFVRSLQEKALVTMLGSGLPASPPQAVNATERAADAVRAVLASRTPS